MKIRGHSDKNDGYAFAPDALVTEVTGPIGLCVSSPHRIRVNHHYRQHQASWFMAPEIQQTLDAIRTEMTGLIKIHLSVVDLPGLIYVVNEE
jgi:hypothetical protein